MKRHFPFQGSQNNLAHTGCPTTNSLHTLLCLWSFLLQEGMWDDAEEYLRSHADASLPFGSIFMACPCDAPRPAHHICPAPGRREA